MIVADTNVLLAFCAVSPGTELADLLWIRDPEWHAPLLWMSEFRNVLMFHYRKGLLPLNGCEKAVLDAREAVPPERTHDVEDDRAFDLAVRSGCSGYDCEFVAVAEKLNVPLLTWDKELLKQFPKRAMKPEDYLKA